MPEIIIQQVHWLACCHLAGLEFLDPNNNLQLEKDDANNYSTYVQENHGNNNASDTDFLSNRSDDNDRHNFWWLTGVGPTMNNNHTEAHNNDTKATNNDDTTSQ